jgi:glycosyltransferase involved in cell wall biosynthesis
VITDVRHGAVMSIWDRCLFGVAPSLWPEPLGLVVHECMSRGKPAIGTEPGGHTDMIVHGETGLLVPSGDAQALAVAMQALLDDPEERMRLGAAARRRSLLATPNVVLPEYERFLRRVRARAQMRATPSPRTGSAAGSAD